MTFQFTQELDVPFDKVVRFFGDVRNLSSISPPYPRMEVVSPSPYVKKGAQFRIQLDFGSFSVQLLSVIDEVGENGMFVDSFRGGLFRVWRHTHAFQPMNEKCLVIDAIECDPSWWFAPFAWVGVHLLFVYRQRALRSVLA